MYGQNMIWVQGEEGARAYMVAPNSTVPLWDSEEQVIYVKSADNLGRPSMRILDYTIRDLPKDEITTLKEEIAELKEQLKSMKGVQNESIVSADESEESDADVKPNEKPNKK